MKFLISLMIIGFGCCSSPVNTFFINEVFSAEISNINLINEYESQYNSYFNKRMDSEKANNILNITNNLYLEYVNIGNYEKAIDTLNNQIKYAEYLNLDTSDINKKIDELHTNPEVYILSNNPNDTQAFRKYFNSEYMHFGINSNNVSNISDNTNEIAVVNMEFLTDNVMSAIDSKYTDLKNSTLYIDVKVPSTNEILNNINNFLYYEYFVYNIAYLSQLENNIILNFSFDNLENLDANLYKNVYMQISNIVKNNSNNIDLMYNHIEDKNYYAGDEYCSLIGTTIEVDSSNDMINIMKNQLNTGINEYNKPIIITDFKINYNSESQEDTSNFITNKINNMGMYANMVNPYIEGIIYSNKNNELDNHLQLINNTYMANSKNKAYVPSEKYNYNSETINLNLYCNNINNATLNTTFELNNITIFETTTAPYSYELNIGNLIVGDNSLKIQIKDNGEYKETLNYNIVKTENNFVTINKIEPIIEEEIFVKPSSFKLDVANIMQYPELPTGCEVTALTTLLNYLDYKVDKTVMAKDFMPRGAIGVTDPSVAFVGNPEVKSSYGCNAPVIVETANKYFESVNSNHKAYNITGATYEELTTYVAKGYPVLVWETMYMLKSYKTAKWTINNNDIYWQANLHCMVLSGYTENKYILADPLKGVVEYDKTLVETRYKELGNQAIIIADCDLDLI